MPQTVCKVPTALLIIRCIWSGQLITEVCTFRRYHINWWYVKRVCTIRNETSRRHRIFPACMLDMNEHDHNFLAKFVQAFFCPKCSCFNVYCESFPLPKNVDQLFDLYRWTTSSPTQLVKMSWTCDFSKWRLQSTSTIALFKIINLFSWVCVKDIGCIGSFL